MKIKLAGIWNYHEVKSWNFKLSVLARCPRLLERRRLQFSHQSCIWEKYLIKGVMSKKGWHKPFQLHYALAKPFSCWVVDQCKYTNSLYCFRYLYSVVCIVCQGTTSLALSATSSTYAHWLAFSLLFFSIVSGVLANSSTWSMAKTRPLPFIKYSLQSPSSYNCLEIIDVTDWKLIIQQWVKASKFIL